MRKFSFFKKNVNPHRIIEFETVRALEIIYYSLIQKIVENFMGQKI